MDKNNIAEYSRTLKIEEEELESVEKQLQKAVTTGFYEAYFQVERQKA